MTDSFVVEPLAAVHDRQTFNSASDVLDRYLKTQAGQDVRRRIANCYVATPGAGVIAGFYTLAAASIPLLEMPEKDAKSLPRYPVLPAALIGRLAVDRKFQRKRLGAALLFDAIRRSLRAEPAVFALIVDAKDDQAVAFYAHFGFAGFTSRPKSMFLPLATAAKA